MTDNEDFITEGGTKKFELSISPPLLSKFALKCRKIVSNVAECTFIILRKDWSTHDHNCLT